MANAYKKLGSNILLFACSSFGTKLIGFFLTPLYTSFLTTEEYGTADMLSTIVSLVVPIFSADIADGVIRFVLDKKNKDSAVLLTALKVISLGTVILAILLIAFRALPFFEYPDFYYIFIFLNFFFTSIYNTFINYMKGKERIKHLMVASLISALLNALCNILFLVRFGFRVNGYLSSHLISISVAAIYLLICAWHYRYLHFKGLGRNRELTKEMLLYSGPLILSGLAWWINNSLDRFFVTFICGVAANGLLAVAYKIPSIISMLQSIFNQAWSLSAIQEFDPEDKNGFMGNIYSYYGCAITICSCALILINVPLAHLLYAKDFFVAWQYAGMLILAQMFGGMSVCISGVFNAVKDTKALATTTVTGAIVNIVLNAALIPFLGVLGATIATVTSNLVMWIVRMIRSRKYIKMKLHLRRDIISYVLVLIQCLVGLTSSHLYIVQAVICVLVLVLYWKEEILITKYGLDRMKKTIKRFHTK